MNGPNLVTQPPGQVGEPSSVSLRSSPASAGSSILGGVRASAAAVDQLQSVLQLSVEQLQSVLQLSPERLVAASAALAQLAQLPATAADESPAQPQRLPFTDQLEGTGAGSDEVELFSAAINALNCDEDGSRSGAGSVGSLCGDLADFHPGESEASDGDGEEPEFVDGVGRLVLLDAPDAAVGIGTADSGGGTIGADEDEVVGPISEIDGPLALLGIRPFDNYTGGYTSGVVSDDGSGSEDEAGEAVSRRAGSGAGRPSRRKSLGIAESRHTYCMRCNTDLNPPEFALDDPLSDCAPVCMADDAMQQNRIRDIAAKRHLRINTRRARRKPDDDPDRRGARYAMYRGVVGWLWANPLGAEQRVRLPTCVVKRVRREFPNPACKESEGCDFGDACERKGHYTGFRTADESRARREGTFACVDLDAVS